MNTPVIQLPDARRLTHPRTILTSDRSSRADAKRRLPIGRDDDLSEAVAHWCQEVGELAGFRRCGFGARIENTNADQRNPWFDLTQRARDNRIRRKGQSRESHIQPGSSPCRVVFTSYKKRVGWLPMQEAPYDSESLLQKLLADHPDLLAGDQINAEEPRRWLLITREMAVPGEQDGAGRWSLDHLFLDQDAIPTLVEVKRSSDTRIRREVDRPDA